MQPSPSAVIFAWTRMRRFECGAAAPSLEDEGSINFVRGRERRGEHFTLALHDARVPVAGRPAAAAHLDREAARAEEGVHNFQKRVVLPKETGLLVWL